MDNFNSYQQAILSGNMSELEQVLIAGGKILWVGNDNILHYYVQHSSNFSASPFDVIKLMQKHNVDINHQNKDGITPLHYLAISNYGITLAKVLIENGALIDITDNNGNTPLWRAVMNYRGEQSKLELIKLLCEKGANPDLENFSGNSPKKMVLRRHQNTVLTGKNKEWDLQPFLNW